MPHHTKRRATEVLEELLSLPIPSRESCYREILRLAEKDTTLDATTILGPWVDKSSLYGFEYEPLMNAISKLDEGSYSSLAQAATEQKANLSYLNNSYLFSYCVDLLFSPTCDCNSRRICYGWPLVPLGLSCLESRDAEHLDYLERYRWQPCTAAQRTALIAYISINVIAGDEDHSLSWRNFWSMLQI